MKKVYFKPPLSPAYLRNGLFRIKSSLNTYWNMDKKLGKHSVDFNTIDLDKNKDGNLYIFDEFPYPWQFKALQQVFTTRGKNILFSLESPIVNPFSHLSLLHNLFNRVYTWDDNKVDNKKYFKFFIGQTRLGLYTKTVSFKKKKFLTFINAKKDVPWIFSKLSPYKENLYKKRLESLDYFTYEIPDDFDFYGRGWDKSKINYKGEVADKIKILSRYKFCLCFENAIAPGYITEKIFDCFKARCVPIYLGAPNIEKVIYKSCFIDFRNFADYESLLNFLQNMSEKTYHRYLKSINTFLSSSETKNVWFKDKFINVVLENLR